MPDQAISGLTLDKPLLLAGRLMFGYWASGVAPAKWLGPIEVDAFTVTPKAGSVEQSAKSPGKHKQVRSTITLPENTEFSFTSLDASPEVMALQLLGSVSAYTQASGSVSDEAVTARLDQWVKLTKKQVSSPVVEDVTDTTTYVLGTDYEVNYVAGLLRALSSGSISEGDVLHVDFDHAAIAGAQVDIATLSQIDLWMILEGQNLDDDEGIILELYQGRCRPSAGQDTMGDSHWTPQIKGIARTPTGYTTPGALTYLGTAPAV